MVNVQYVIVESLPYHDSRKTLYGECEELMGILGNHEDECEESHGILHKEWMDEDDDKGIMHKDWMDEPEPPGIFHKHSEMCEHDEDD